MSRVFLKYEWHNHVPLIRGSAHLGQLCGDFTTWYNRWRPHMRHGGATPGSVFRSGRVPVGPPRQAKSVPPDIEARRFADTGVSAYRLKDAA